MAVTRPGRDLSASLSPVGPGPWGTEDRALSPTPSLHSTEQRWCCLALSLRSEQTRFPSTPTGFPSRGINSQRRVTVQPWALTHASGLCSILGPQWPEQPPQGDAAFKGLRRGRTGLGGGRGERSLQPMPRSLTSCRAARSWGAMAGWHFCTSW